MRSRVGINASTSPTEKCVRAMPAPYIILAPATYAPATARSGSPTPRCPASVSLNMLQPHDAEDASATDPEGDVTYARVEAAIDFLSRHRVQQPSLDDVAAHVGQSPFHFQRL